MACNCITTVDADLAERNTRIMLPIMLGGDQTPRPMIVTDQIETGRGKKKAVGLFATFCPFCGTRYVPTEIRNPTAWFYSAHQEAEWWSKGAQDRDETIAMAREAHPGETVWIVEAKRQLPSFDVFCAAQIDEKLADDECWDEGGFEGGHPDGPHADDLQRRLEATLRQWFAECCDLHGAQLDFVHGPEKVPAEALAQEASL